MHLILLTVLSFFLFVDEVFAYVGPGLGLGAIGAFFGAIFAFLLALIGIIWYPVKRIIKKYKADKYSKEESKK
jgi:hypothetical protein